MKWNRKRFVWWVVAFAIIFIPLDQYSPRFYMSAPIDGHVVDAETEEPIDGAIIVVDWLLTSGLQGGYPVGDMAVFEVMTDASGGFQIPGWGPRWNKSLGHLRADQPRLRVFKPGYSPAIVDNALPGRLYPEWGPRYSKFRLDGATFELKRFEGSLVQYAEEVEDLMFWLDFAFMTLAGKYAATIPCTHLAFEKLRQVFDDAGVINNITYQTLGGNQAHCGNVMESFEGAPE